MSRSDVKSMVLFAAGLISMALTSGTATAATRTWTGSNFSNDTLWQDALNWDGSLTFPAIGDSLLFAGTNGLNNTNNFTTGTTFSGLMFDATAGAFSLTGNAINFGPVIQDSSGNVSAGNFTTNSAGNQTIGLPVTIAAGNHTIVTSSGSGQLNLTGPVTRSANATVQFTKGGGNINFNGSGLANDSSGILGGWATIGLVPTPATGPRLTAATTSSLTTDTPPSVAAQIWAYPLSGGNAANNIKINSRSSTANTLNSTTAGTYDIDTLMWEPSSASRRSNAEHFLQPDTASRGQRRHRQHECGQSQLQRRQRSKAILPSPPAAPTIQTANSPSSPTRSATATSAFKSTRPITDNGSGVRQRQCAWRCRAQAELDIHRRAIRAQRTGAGEFRRRFWKRNRVCDARIQRLSLERWHGANFTNNFTLASLGSPSTDPFAIRGQANDTLSGIITLASTSVIAPSGTLTTTNLITGPGGLIVTGAYADGSLHLDEASPNTYVGDTTIDATNGHQHHHLDRRLDAQQHHAQRRRLRKYGAQWRRIECGSVRCGRNPANDQRLDLRRRNRQHADHQCLARRIARRRRQRRQRKLWRQDYRLGGNPAAFTKTGAGIQTLAGSNSFLARRPSRTACSL